MKKYLTRSEIETFIPPIKELSWDHWAYTRARIEKKFSRVIDGKNTHFYSFQAALKLKRLLKKERPELFRKPTGGGGESNATDRSAAV